MSELDELTSHELEALEEIGRRLKRKEKVGKQDELKYLRWREANLSKALQEASDPKKFAKIYHKLEGVRHKKDLVNQEIMNSGDRGGGVMGQGSIKDSRNPPR